MFTLLSIAVSIALSVNSAPLFINSELCDTPIGIEIKDGNPVGVPRMPSVIPIQGVVSGSTIYLSFTDDLGLIAVELSESVNGLILQTVVDSSYLSAAIPFSGAPGEYYITFTLPSGAEYIGTVVKM